MLKLAFNSSKWNPNEQTWKTCISSIDYNEAIKISKYHHKNTTKNSLIGQIMIRYAATTQLGLRWNCVDCRRSFYNRPYIRNAGHFDVNLAHDGEWTVAVASKLHFVGVDIVYMNRREEMDDYNLIVQKKLSQSSFDYIFALDECRLHRFYRIWALSESYIKAIGRGLGFNIKRLSFKVIEEDVWPCYSTTVNVDGVFQNRIRFEELKLGNNDHFVAICLISSNQNNFDEFDVVSENFKYLTIKELLCMSTNLFEIDKISELSWNNFIMKSGHPQ